MNAIHANFARQGLVRPQDGRLLGGVCAGVAQRFGMDPWAVRALFVTTLVVVPGSQVVVYPLLWALMPDNGAAVPAADRYPAA
ncbi:PspC domain-containing protein [Kineococcus glutinatus]|uniref:Phage shock protein PspC N-terminal domain-containing protein n=1 Tax=Kineococcus glutinatus TaxID=1070872 RepID=A0ABP9HTS6_9ACTN